MLTEYTLFIISMIIAAILMYTVGLLWFTDRVNRQVRGLFVSGIALWFWTVFSAFAMLVKDTPYYPFIYTIRIIFLSISPWCFLWFILELSGSTVLNFLPVRIICILIPFADSILLATNLIHHRIYAVYQYPIPIYGPDYIIHGVMAYSAMLFCVIFMFIYVIKNMKEKPIVLAQGLGFLLLTGVNIIYTAKIINFAHDIGPYTFFFMYILFAFSTHRSRLFNFRTHLLNSLFETNQNVMLMVDREGFISDINSAFAGVFPDFELKPKLTQVHELLDYFSSRAIWQLPNTLFDDIARKNFKGGEFAMDYGEGKQRSFSVSRQFAYSERPSYGYSIVIADISSYHSMINEINEQNQTLTSLKELAETASHAKSTFLANMSHEIRTPLNAIIGLGEMELQNELPAGTRENLRKMLGSGKVLLNIINDILDISKIESGRFELVPGEYNIPSLINDTVSMNIIRIGSKPITFKLDPDGNLPMRLWGDELRVRQILNNLLSNAFKYTREGQVEFKIGGIQEGDDYWLEASVSDSGIGIKEEDIGKLFTEYSQLDTRTNRYIEGTGLGLVICKNLAEMMNGTITVKSTYGTGSVFSVRIKQKIVDAIPLGKEGAENLRYLRFLEQGQDRRKRNLPRIRMPYARVLVVDDVDTNLDVARGMMAPYDLTIDCVASGPEAINLIQEEKNIYNALFMDHMMPGMDGIEAVKIIREIKSEYAKNIPIIALTANALVGNEDLFLRNGFQAFLPKPIDIIKLDSILNQWVRDKSKEKEQEPIQEKQEKPMPERGLFKTPLEGMDFYLGLKRFADNETTYAQVIKSYVDHTPPLLEKLKNHTDLAEYAVTAHGIKGSSYGICAEAIGKKAEELEAAAKSSDAEKVSAETAGFIASAEKLIAGLKALLPDTPAPEGKGRLPSPDKALLQKLLDADKNFDHTGMEKILAELDNYEYESNSDLIPWLKQQIEELEYDAIQDKLTALLG
ncbi:hybrid sensor histidine kinase/response regulator [Leadbettera azotonutricia]|uniref:histidine kinase n=1 Tax=Leadbettera azotonutricia (strain ATCC BAA-888 / DSM 13862 / ZAS-9) TaxID=545695 RepID=F5Y8H8_LEAAZ|nr:ATP-binding protein [Leadbettera azotonutricia]AEF81764.1 sensor protein GacS [Leadbettera azotonutricia ZAS-9]